ncbi:MAG: DUF3526 domain-containing protein [Flavobacteriaceae bacterium]
MHLLLFKQFLQLRVVKMASILILAMSLLSFALGEQFITEKKEATQAVSALQESLLEDHLSAQYDMGLMLYYLKFAVIKQIHPLNGFSFGQSDILSQIKHITIRGLENQIYNVNLSNPLHLHTGSLDFGFVLIYLFPLLIIAFCYQVFSKEQETGIWLLIKVQNITPLRYISMQLAVRLLWTLLLFLCMFWLGIWWLKVPLDGNTWNFLAISILYLIFWFSLCFLVIGAKRSSNFTIGSLLSLWLIMVVLLPAVINNWVTQKYPIEESFTGMIKQRDSYHTKWDSNKRETVQKFYEHYPQFESYGFPPEEGFNWLWYYAMQQMGDDETLVEQKAIRQKINQRHLRSKKIAQWVPPLFTQMKFNDFAQSGLQSQLEFQDQTAALHEKLRLFYYPKIFDNSSVEDEDWENAQPVFLQATADKPLHLGQYAPLLIAIIICFGLGRIALRTKES